MRSRNAHATGERQAGNENLASGGRRVTQSLPYNPNTNSSTSNAETQLPKLPTPKKPQPTKSQKPPTHHAHTRCLLTAATREIRGHRSRRGTTTTTATESWLTLHSRCHQINLVDHACSVGLCVSRSPHPHPHNNQPSLSRVAQPRTIVSSARPSCHPHPPHPPKVTQPQPQVGKSASRGRPRGRNSWGDARAQRNGAHLARCHRETRDCSVAAQDGKSPQAALWCRLCHPKSDSRPPGHQSNLPLAGIGTALRFFSRVSGGYWS